MNSMAFQITCNTIVLSTASQCSVIRKGNTIIGSMDPVDCPHIQTQKGLVSHKAFENHGINHQCPSPTAARLFTPVFQDHSVVLQLVYHLPSPVDKTRRFGAWNMDSCATRIVTYRMGWDELRCDDIKVKVNHSLK